MPRVRYPSANSTAIRSGRVDADAVVAFAAATNDANPLYESGAAVPPLFSATLVLDSSFNADRGIDGSPVKVTGARGTVHGEHDVFFHKPLIPEMVVRWNSSTCSAKRSGSGVLVTDRIAIESVSGELLVEHFWSSFHVGGQIDREIGAPLPDHRFPEGSRPHPVATKVIPVDRDQAFRYAGVSGDRVGHAIDDEQARADGYPSKILQGMCTLGMVSGALVDMAAEGDPNKITRIAVRFSAPTFPRKKLLVTTYPIDLRQGRHSAGAASGATHPRRALAFEAIQDGVAVIKHGRVELSPSA